MTLTTEQRELIESNIYIRESDGAIVHQSILDREFPMTVLGWIMTLIEDHIEYVDNPDDEEVIDWVEVWKEYDRDPVH